MTGAAMKMMLLKTCLQYMLLRTMGPSKNQFLHIGDESALSSAAHSLQNLIEPKKKGIVLDLTAYSGALAIVAGRLISHLNDAGERDSKGRGSEELEARSCGWHVVRIEHSRPLLQVVKDAFRQNAIDAFASAHSDVKEALLFAFDAKKRRESDSRFLSLPAPSTTTTSAFAASRSPSSSGDVASPSIVYGSDSSVVDDGSEKAAVSEQIVVVAPPPTGNFFSDSPTGALSNEAYLSAVIEALAEIAQLIERKDDEEKRREGGETEEKEEREEEGTVKAAADRPSLSLPSTVTVSIFPRRVAIKALLCFVPPQPQTVSIPLPKKGSVGVAGGFDLSPFNGFRPKGLEIVRGDDLCFVEMSEPTVVWDLSLEEAANAVNEGSGTRSELRSILRTSETKKELKVTQNGFYNAVFLYCDEDWESGRTVSRRPGTRKEDETATTDPSTAGREAFVYGGKGRQQLLQCFWEDAVGVEGKRVEKGDEITLLFRHDEGSLTVSRCSELDDKESEVKEENKKITTEDENEKDKGGKEAEGEDRAERQERGKDREMEETSSATVCRWHFGMLHDVERNSLYRRSIETTLRRALLTNGDESAVKRSCTVLDIGAGTGLLAMMAAREAKLLQSRQEREEEIADSSAQNGETPGELSLPIRVFSLEALKDIAKIAENIVVSNGFDGESVTVLPIHSKKLSVKKRHESHESEESQSDVALEERVDIVVSEIVDAGLLGEGVLPSLIDAAERLARTRAHCIPASATVFAQLVHIPVQSAPLTFFLDSVRYSENESFSFHPFEIFRGDEGSYEQIRLSEVSHTSLSNVFEVFSFDFQGLFDEGEAALKKRAEYLKGRRRRVQVPCHIDGTVNAVVFWFDLHIAPGVVFSTSPYEGNNFFKDREPSSEPFLAFFDAIPDELRQWKPSIDSVKGEVQRNCWKQAVTFLSSPVNVTADTAVDLLAQHSSTRVSFKVLSTNE